MRTFFTVLLVLVSLFPVMAHEGHDHVDVDVAPLVTQTVAPRLVVQSEALELVGIVQDRQLIIYLDTLATNEPITNAKIEIESGNFKGVAQPTQDGSYFLIIDQILTAGKHDLILTIQMPTFSDLLLGTLDVPVVAPIPQSEDIWHTLFHTPFNLKIILSMLLINLLILSIVIYVYKSKHSTPVVMLLLSAFLLNSLSTFAHDGETHEPEAKKPTHLPFNDAPSRLADGRVFVPKSVQRLLGIRTQLTEITEVSPSVELSGHIIPDPNYSGRVQAPLAGWLELAAESLPNLGEPVEKGQVLAHLNAINSNVDRTDRQAELANLNGQIDKAHKNLVRLKKLGSNAAEKDVDETNTELKSLQARREVIGRGLSTKIPLIAPVKGVIATRNAFHGQVVEARDILFEIVNPDKFWVEALVYEPTLTAQLDKARAVTTSHQSFSLTFIGASYQLREHALPVQFRIEPPAPLLSVAQPVKVFAQTKQRLSGIRATQAAVLKGQHQDNIVWIHKQPEYFQAVKVQIHPLDDNQLLITSGLQSGERMVMKGASLLDQIR